MPLRQRLLDSAALIARAGVGTVFIVHGWQKVQIGITETANRLDLLNVPLPTGAAVYTTFVQLLGGVALFLGLGLPVVGVLLFVDMVGAFAFVNGGHGLLINGGGATPMHRGYELVLVLGVASLLFAAGGGGRFTLDRYLAQRRFARPASDEDAADLEWAEQLRHSRDEDDTERQLESSPAARSSRIRRKRRSAAPPPAAPDAPAVPDLDRSPAQQATDQASDPTAGQADAQAAAQGVEQTTGQSRSRRRGKSAPKPRLATEIATADPVPDPDGSDEPSG